MPCLLSALGTWGLEPGHIVGVEDATSVGVLGTSRQRDLWAAQRQKPRPAAWLLHPVWLNPREKPGEQGELAAWWYFPSLVTHHHRDN